MYYSPAASLGCCVTVAGRWPNTTHLPTASYRSSRHSEDVQFDLAHNAKPRGEIKSGIPRPETLQIYPNPTTPSSIAATNSQNPPLHDRSQTAIFPLAFQTIIQMENRDHCHSLCLHIHTHIDSSSRTYPLTLLSCHQVNVPKTRRTYCKGKDCKKHTQHKVTQYKAGKVCPSLPAPLPTPPSPSSQTHTNPSYTRPHR